mmetsp:Transcript_77992/g.135159  ORF Transcript_77992/g.135159 Transcript_77992/m.135159 type:complete len:346 (+) Transcript_77992:100-1137(+)
MLQLVQLAGLLLLDLPHAIELESRDAALLRKVEISASAGRLRESGASSRKVKANASLTGLHQAEIAAYDKQFLAKVEQQSRTWLRDNTWSNFNSTGVSNGTNRIMNADRLKMGMMRKTSARKKKEQTILASVESESSQDSQTPGLECEYNKFEGTCAMEDGEDAKGYMLDVGYMSEDECQQSCCTTSCGCMAVRWQKLDEHCAAYAVPVTHGIQTLNTHKWVTCYIKTPPCTTTTTIAPPPSQPQPSHPMLAADAGAGGLHLAEKKHETEEEAIEEAENETRAACGGGGGNSSKGGNSSNASNVVCDEEEEGWPWWYYALIIGGVVVVLGAAGGAAAASNQKQHH